jgi:hypothetical protein
MKEKLIFRVRAIRSPTGYTGENLCESIAVALAHIDSYGIKIINQRQRAALKKEPPMNPVYFWNNKTIQSSEVVVSICGEWLIGE